jgi:hypothetical protein
MTTTEDMAAAREVQACYQAILGIDSIRKSLNRLSVTLVDIGERVATHGTGIDEVEGLSRLAWLQAKGERSLEKRRGWWG